MMNYVDRMAVARPAEAALEAWLTERGWKWCKLSQEDHVHRDATYAMARVTDSTDQLKALLATLISLGESCQQHVGLVNQMLMDAELLKQYRYMPDYIAQTDEGIWYVDAKAGKHVEQQTFEAAMHRNTVLAPTYLAMLLPAENELRIMHVSDIRFADREWKPGNGSGKACKRVDFARTKQLGRALPVDGDVVPL